MEILPGIHRIESDLGERFMCQYLLLGEERTVLIDTGLAGTPEEVIVPYLEEIGLGVEDVDEVIISHSDVDHCGGNRALKEMNPSLRFSCGEADRAWVESTGRIIAEIYLWSEPYGFGPDEESKTGSARSSAATPPLTWACAAARPCGWGRLAGRVPAPPGPHAGPPRHLGCEERRGHHHGRSAREGYL